ncbi:MAG: DUF11 domain-containing protein, partial [Actinomycetia bacterium]|nr:DUF11 domain-containing protein [Actinomycetes bacterium]
IGYTFAVTNTGNVTVDGIAVSDVPVPPAGGLDAPGVVCPGGSLAPGESTTCAGSYTVTQADMDHGSVSDAATASGTGPGGDPVESGPSDEVRVEVDQDASLSVVKSVDTALTPDPLTAAGQRVHYLFAVTNTGNVTVDGIAVSDVPVPPAGGLDAPGVSCPTVSLAPGGSMVCEGSYTVTQVDVDHGSVSDVATVTGSGPGGDPVDPPSSQVTVDVPPAPGLSLVKSADTDSFVIGQTITYEFLVTNTGNVTVGGIEVQDGSFTGSGELSPVVCPSSSLSPGESQTCAATYVTTQADVDAGGISNSATATGEPPNDDSPLVTSPPSTSRVPSDQRPALVVVKTANTARFGSGQLITYTFTVTNTGNVTLRDVAPVERSFSGSGGMSSLECPVNRELAPGASLVCAATYTATAADVAVGKLVNTASATGRLPTGSGPDAPPVTATLTTVTITVMASAKGALINTGVGADARGDPGGAHITLAGLLLAFIGGTGLLVLPGWRRARE